jgi:hypothetical protein
MVGLPERAPDAAQRNPMIDHDLVALFAAALAQLDRPSIRYTRCCTRAW